MAARQTEGSSKMPVHLYNAIWTVVAYASINGASFLVGEFFPSSLPRAHPSKNAPTTLIGRSLSAFASGVASWLAGGCCICFFNPRARSALPAAGLKTFCVLCVFSPFFVVCVCVFYYVYVLLAGLTSLSRGDWLTYCSVAFEAWLMDRLSRSPSPSSFSPPPPFFFLQFLSVR